MKKIKWLLFLLVAAMLVSFGNVKAMAEETQGSGVYTVSEGLPEQMTVREDEIYEKLYYIDEEGTKRRIYANSKCTIISSNPNVVEASMWDGYVYYFSLKAKAAGTTTITITDKEGKKYTHNIKVIPHKEGVIEELELKRTMRKGSTFEFEWSYKIDFGITKELFRRDHMQVTSSNPKVVQVIKDEDDILSPGWILKAKKPGTAKIKIVVNNPDGDIKNFTRTMTVTVKQGKACRRTTMRSPLKSWTYYNKNEVAFKILEGEVEYQIYRSTKKNSGYKRVKTVKIDGRKNIMDDMTMEYVNGKYSGTIATYYSFEDTKGIKQNKRYYYKVKTRYYNKDSYNSNAWSKFSKPVEFWTAYKPVTKGLQYSEATCVAKWPKTKKAAGYIYEMEAFVIHGYNIFLQPVSSLIYQGRSSRTNQARVGKIQGLEPGRYDIVKLNRVYPLAKHGKYYYMNGRKPCKSMKSFHYIDE